MFARHMIKGTWLYCSENCLINDNTNAPKVDGWPNVDSSEYIPERASLTDIDAATWLANRGWANHKCDRCGGGLIN